MTVMSTMARSTNKVKCMVSGTCFSRMVSVIKGCLTKVLETVLALHLISLEISTKESIKEVLERVREFSKLSMINFMKADGVTTKCMAEEEKLSPTENAS